MDPRVRELAKNLVKYSMAVKPGEKVLIEAFDAGTFEMVEALIEEVYAAQGLPFYRLHDDLVRRAQLMHADQEAFELEARIQREQMEAMTCYVGLRGSKNVLEMSDVPSSSMRVYSSTIGKKVHMEVRVPKTRWVVLRFPNPTFAQAAKLSTRAFEEFFYKACLLDYAKMSKSMDPLVDLMQRTDQVHIKGPGTDLRFSIKGIPAIKCDGKLNIPDGEVFTAPVKESANGVLTTNTPTLYEGGFYNGVKLVFKDGKIIEESCETGDAAKLKAIFDRDEGSRYVGEFALGVNPEIRREMLDILFDEKIAGSFHFTPGGCYDDASNGNKSEIHWDLVTRQFPESGGGEIWFDGVLIRKDGLFLPADLLALNP